MQAWPLRGDSFYLFFAAIRIGALSIDLHAANLVTFVRMPGAQALLQIINIAVPRMLLSCKLCSDHDARLSWHLLLRRCMYGGCDLQIDMLISLYRLRC